MYNVAMQTNIEITQAFMETPDGVLSIHQISKKLKLPYGTAYNRIHLLKESGIIQMLQQGKAKLCALNPENPMTASLLALGSAQKTDNFVRNNPDAGGLLKRIRNSIKDYCLDTLSTVILLTPETLGQICELASSRTIPTQEIPELSLDFFLIRSEKDFDDSGLEKLVTSMLPPEIPTRATTMTLDRHTLLGMFTENENEAGLAAYSMLYDGLVLFGFENFYTLILEAFSKKLTT